MLSVNHRGKHTRDSIGGSVFVDTIAGKLVVWLCMTESVQLNLLKMDLGGSFCLVLPSLHSDCQGRCCAILLPSLCSIDFLHISVFLSKKCSTNRENSPYLHHHLHIHCAIFFTFCFVDIFPCCPHPIHFSL